MSKLNFSPNLLIEVQEFNRFQRFLQEEGSRTEFLFSVKNFGIVRGTWLIDGSESAAIDAFSCFSSGPGSQNVIVQPGVIVSPVGIAIKKPQTVLEIPNNGVWYWIAASYLETNEEFGTCTIDADGNLISDGNHNFNKILRGQPYFPNKVKFTNSSNNTQEYEVATIVSDTQAILIGDFIPESGVKISVIGTFTEGYIPDSNEKFTYKIDSVAFNLIQETVFNEPPTKLFTQYFIARVKCQALNLSIEDKRTQFYLTRDRYEIEIQEENQNLPTSQNNILGVDFVRFNPQNTAQDTNQLQISWGLRSSNWTINTIDKTISFNSCEGGLVKDSDLSVVSVLEFAENWQIVTKTGKRNKVVLSSIVSGQLLLNLENLNPSDFVAGEEIRLVPDFEEIQFNVKYDDSVPVKYQHLEFTKTFPVVDSKGVIEIPIVSQSMFKVSINYNYKVNKTKSKIFVLRDDTVGYYAESSFQESGILKTSGTLRKPYNYSANGYIEIVPSISNVKNLISRFFIGDKNGVQVNYVSDLITSSAGLRELQVGVDKKEQVFKALSSSGSYNLTQNLFINIKTDGAVEGNVFRIKFLGFFNNAIHRLQTLPATIKIKQDINILLPDSTGTTLYNFNWYDFAYLNYASNSDGLIFDFVFDGTNWIFSEVVTKDKLTNAVYPDNWITVSNGSSFNPITYGTDVEKWVSGNTGEQVPLRLQKIGNRVFMSGGVLIKNWGGDGSTPSTLKTGTLFSGIPSEYRPSRTVFLEPTLLWNQNWNGDSPEKVFVQKSISIGSGSNSASFVITTKNAVTIPNSGSDGPLEFFFDGLSYSLD